MSWRLSRPFWRNPAHWTPQFSPKVALYKLFLQGWRNVPANNDVDFPIGDDEASASRNLAAISIEPRIAFLLSAMESFNPKEISQILNCSEREARNLIDSAGREISAQIRTAVLIIEDEPLIAGDIQNLVEQLGHEVTTIARTHKEAVRAALKRRPGLILSDIQLADGSSGLDAVNEILVSQEVPVIFITGYPELFLTGQAPEPAFLITKPFTVIGQSRHQPSPVLQIQGGHGEGGRGLRGSRGRRAA